ncbi:hypothetical protein [Arthrobacter globiformis]|uniref:hypothetical protein n=1 Tax=Arthrobacter globiformis TaxID=1665 RepID=UPI00278E1AA4|nr:hypothetical protein [Arthrobacter globiformis]MDQ0619197.1 hypothetical protein [Arthrobacter globiformis]
MNARTQDYRRLRRAVTMCVNAHDLLGILDDAPPDEYNPEIEDFTRLIAKGEVITPEVVAAVCHKWFGDSKEAPPPPTPRITALANDLRAIQRENAAQPRRTQSTDRD